MPTFTPPTVNESSSDHFFGRYSVPVGQSVVRTDGVFQTTPYPWLGDLDGLTDGTDYFLGGHIYTITDEVAAELIAAGYDVDDASGFGLGPFGIGEFGV
jgi:hypothetical protein